MLLRRGGLGGMQLSSTTHTTSPKDRDRLGASTNRIPQPSAHSSGMQLRRGRRPGLAMRRSAALPHRAAQPLPRTTPERVWGASRGVLRVPKVAAVVGSTSAGGAHSNTHHTTSTAGGAGAGAGAGSGADSASASASNSSRWNQSPRAAPRSIHAPARYTPHHVPTVQQLQAADEAKLAAAQSRAARLKRLARVHIPYVPPEPIPQRTAQPASASHTASSGTATGAPVSWYDRAHKPHPPTTTAPPRAPPQPRPERRAATASFDLRQQILSMHPHILYEDATDTTPHADGDEPGALASSALAPTSMSARSWDVPHDLVRTLTSARAAQSVDVAADDASSQHAAGPRHHRSAWDLAMEMSRGMVTPAPAPAPAPSPALAPASAPAPAPAPAPSPSSSLASDIPPAALALVRALSHESTASAASGGGGSEEDVGDIVACIDSAGSIQALMDVFDKLYEHLISHVDSRHIDVKRHIIAASKAKQTKSPALWTKDVAQQFRRVVILDYFEV